MMKAMLSVGFLVRGKTGIPAKAAITRSVAASLIGANRHCMKLID